MGSTPALEAIKKGNKIGVIIGMVLEVIRKGKIFNMDKLAKVYEKLIVGISTCVMGFLVANAGIVFLVALIKIARFWYGVLGF